MILRLRKGDSFEVGPWNLGKRYKLINALAIFFVVLVVFALGSYQMTWITRDYDFYELLLPQILRGVGMMCAMVPTNTIAIAAISLFLCSTDQCAVLSAASMVTRLNRSCFS